MVSPGTPAVTRFIEADAITYNFVKKRKPELLLEMFGMERCRKLEKRDVALVMCLVLTRCKKLFCKEAGRVRNKYFPPEAFVGFKDYSFTFNPRLSLAEAVIGAEQQARSKIIWQLAPLHPYALLLLLLLWRRSDKQPAERCWYLRPPRCSTTGKRRRDECVVSIDRGTYKQQGRRLAALSFRPSVCLSVARFASA
ncbi:hypothetical protein QR680_012162 [Steinernema hermaphroditum]|uniref:Uncharacterized protein n=1 Tax=Steinernema hermaphroditum TaxID=289476 RepID=A0AA39I137_9BILA|nr:hypothetical protein QR680_012162 [Steinernema hermaphroditum]